MAGIARNFTKVVAEEGASVAVQKAAENRGYVNKDEEGTCARVRL